MAGTSREILLRVAEALKIDVRKVVEIIEADYRGWIVHPARGMVGRTIDHDQHNAGSLKQGMSDTTSSGLVHPTGAGMSAVRGSGSRRVKETDFPLPARVQHWAVPFTQEAAAKVTELRKFAKWQADAANAMVARLRAMDEEPTPENWSAEFWRVTHERSKEDALFPNSRLDTPVTDEDFHTDRIGDNVPGEGAVWDPENRLWVRGQPTPVSEIYRETGERTLTRFRTEGVTGDELRNTVRLCDGTEVTGNRIVRGDSAEQASHDQMKRNAARGLDVSKWPSLTPNQVIVIPATEADRRRILQDTFEQLARPGAFTTETWADVAYKLFQAPQRVNGSDSVIRTYLAATAEYRMGRVPAFPHDIDLRAMTMSQRDFVKYVVDHDALATRA